MDINEIYSNNMNSQFLNVSLTEIKSALASAFVAAILAMGVNIIQVGNIFAIDWHNLANAGALAAVVAVVSFIKSAFTTSTGDFLGAVKIK